MRIGADRLRGSAYSQPLHRLQAVAPEGAFEHVQFGAQKFDLGAQVVAYGLARDQGEIAQPGVVGGIWMLRFQVPASRPLLSSAPSTG